MALAISTAIMTGRMCVICPVSSNMITEVDMVWVTPPAIAAAPVGEGQSLLRGGAISIEGRGNQYQGEGQSVSRGGASVSRAGAISIKGRGNQ